MKTLLSVSALCLTACGGGSGNSTPVVVPVDISDTSSATYRTSIQAFAETYIGGYLLLPSIFDVVGAASYTGNGNGGGNLSAFSSGGPDGTTIFTNAVFLGGVASTSPALSGVTSNTYTLTGTLTTSNTFFTNTIVKNVVLSGVSAFTGSTPAIPSFSLASIANITGTTSPQLPSYTVTLSSGSASFLLGASTYAVSALNIQTAAPATASFSVTTTDATQAQLFQITKGANTYAVNLVSGPLLISGQNSVVSSGTQQISNAALACSPITVQYLSATQFSMACGGNSITKNWADADVVAALASAKQ